jgi:hypothetical protein
MGRCPQAVYGLSAASPPQSKKDRGCDCSPWTAAVLGRALRPLAEAAGRELAPTGHEKLDEMTVIAVSLRPPHADDRPAMSGGSSPIKPDLTRPGAHSVPKPP